MNHRGDKKLYFTKQAISCRIVAVQSMFVFKLRPEASRFADGWSLLVISFV